MNIFFYPTESNNDYIKNILKNLEANQIKIINKDLNDIFRKMIVKGFKWRVSGKVKIFHFNWIMNFAAKKGFINFIRFCILIIWVKFLKLFKARIIITFHNKLPHKNNNRLRTKFFRKFLIRNCDNIIIHSKSSKNFLYKKFSKSLVKKKIKYIPHGMYNTDDINSLKINLLDKITKKDFKLGFVGTIKKYKNIDLFINAFEELNLKNTKLIIAGKADKNLDKSTFRYNENIIFIDKFLSMGEIKYIFKKIDVLVLPYSKKTVLNSGLMYLSFSLSRPVIISDIAAARDLKKYNFVFQYSYKNQKNHLNVLKNKILFCKSLYDEDSNKLKKYGEKAKIYIKKYHNWENIINHYIELYRNYS